MLLTSTRYAFTIVPRRRLYTASFTLRPYQLNCLEACLRALSSGARRIGVSLPTGSGKTTIFISLLSKLPPSSTHASAQKSLILVNSIELARQSAEQATRLLPNLSVEIEQGSQHKATGQADITVATYQTLRSPERLAKFDPRAFKAVIVDEAHHAAAPSYRRLLSYFHCDIKSPDIEPGQLLHTHRIPIIGFSATFSRHDGLALGSVFERIVYHQDFLELIKEQWLCDVRFTSVRANIDLKQVTINSRTGDFNPSSLAHVINTDTLNDLVVRSWLDRASTRKSTLVFCVNVAHVDLLTRTFRRHGVDARSVDSRTPAQQRRSTLEAFKAGQFAVLVNCSVMTEGTDIPNIDCVIVARPTRSRNLFAQMIGRGMRLSPNTGKRDCQIMDFVDSQSRVVGLVSIPTLFGLDPSEIDIEDETTSSLERIAEQRIRNPVNPDSATAVPEPESVTYVDYENPLAFLGESSGALHVAKWSKNAWVGCGDDIYVLECTGKGYVRIEPTKDEGTPRFLGCYVAPMLDMLSAQTLKLSPFMRKRHIVTAEHLSDAVRGCDTYVAKRVMRGKLALGLLRTAKWRQAAATDKQKQWIAKWWAKRDMKPIEAVLESSELKQLTKGEAANIMTRLKHGAQSRHERKIRKQKAAVKALIKERTRRQREIVQVGSLAA